MVSDYWKVKWGIIAHHVVYNVSYLISLTEFLPGRSRTDIMQTRTRADAVILTRVLTNLLGTAADPMYAHAKNLTFHIYKATT